MSESRRIAIVQSNYIPWKGYFDLVNSVDEFVLFDDRQYTRRDWRNRNLIKTDRGTRWLTIPVLVGGQYLQRIDEVRVAQTDWAKRHWDQLVQVYRRAPHFNRAAELLMPLYLSPQPELLSEINRSFLEALSAILGIRTTFSWSTDYPDDSDSRAGLKTERLVSICRAAGATHYLSGPAARDYIDASCFEAAGIHLEYFDYSDYPEYPQVHPPFAHGVSILDLLFNTGNDAPAFMKTFATRVLA